MREVIHEPARSPRPVTRARSTILLASRSAIVQAGHGPAYEAALDPETRRTLDYAVAGVWLPLDVAKAHYAACDAIGLASNVVAEIGRATNERMKGTLYGTFIRVFNEVGGTPWNVLPHWERFWHRAYDGGTVRVWKTGPKDAQVDVLACSLCQSPYYRSALRGLSHGFIEVFCERAYAQEIASTPDGVSYRYQWA